MDLAGKLQLGPGQSLAVVGQPEGVVLDLGTDHPVADEADAVIVFCRRRGDLERMSDTFVPPAKRDVLAELVKARGVQPVRQVALDDTWSALRLRPA